MKRRLAIAVLLLLAAAFPALLSLPFTESGTRFLVDRANQLDGLHIRLTGGRLAGRLELEQIQLAAGKVRLELKSISSVLDSACLWRSVVCFSRLSAASVEVDINGSDGGAEAANAGEKALLQWPVRVEVPELKIGELHVSWPGGQWRQGQLRAGITLFDSTLQADHGQIKDAELLLEPSNDEPDPGARSLTSIYLPLELLVNGLTLENPEVIIGEVSEALETIGLAGQWREYDLHLDSLAVRSPRGALSLSGDLAFVDDWPLSISADLEASQLEDYGVQQLHARLQGDISNASLDLSSQGDFSGTLVAQVEGDLSRQLVAFEAELQGLGYERLQLRAQGSHGAGELQLESVVLRDKASDSELRFSATADYSDQFVIDAEFESGGLALPQLVEPLVGRLKGGGQLSFAQQADSWQLTASALQLGGQVNELPAALSGHLQLMQGGQLGNTRLQGEFNGVRAELEGDPSGRASLELRVDEFARWQEGARGGLHLSATRAVGNNHFDLQGRLLQPAFGSLSAEAGAISGLIAPGLEEFDLVLDLQSPGLGEMELATLQFKAEGSLEQHRLSLHSLGDLEGELSLRGGVAGADWRGKLAPATLDTRHGQWSLAKQVAFDFDGAAKVLSVQSHCWRHPQLDFCLGDASFGASGGLEVTARGDVAAFNGLVPPDLKFKGTMDASMVARWGDGAPLQLQGRGLSRDVSVTRYYGLGDDITISWDSLATTLQADESGVIIAADMERGGRPVLALALQLPPEREGQLQGQLQLRQMQLDTMAPWAPELSRLEGELSGEIDIAGSIGDPEFTGLVTLSRGNLALEGNPTEVTQLQISLLLRGDQADIQGQALLGGGDLQIAGSALLSPELRLGLELSGSRHQILVPPSTELVVSEDLMIAVVPGLIDVSGEIRVAEGVLRHEQLPAGSVALSPDVVEVDLTGNPIVEDDRWDIRSDVWVRLRDRFRVAGDNLNATVGGDLHLRQEPGKPLQLFGNLNIVGGELQAYRQQLVIRRGTVAFSGDPGNPELDVRAERDLREQGITVGASLQGSLEEPRLEVYSDPPMSQGETMSYLVRGRGLDSGAGADGTSLALAMGANVVNQSGILAPVNRLPGISNVSFGSSGTDDDTAATVSGYLGERIYLSYGIGLYEPINVLTARLYLQSRLWIEVVSRLENSVDIYYSFDID